MSSDTVLTEAEEGKKVIDNVGGEVGRIVEVTDGTAHVEPDPSIADTVMSKLGWGSGNDETYELEASAVDTVTDDEVRLGGL